MSTPLTKSLCDYQTNPTAENLSAVGDLILALNIEDRWSAISEITLGEDSELKLALAKAVLVSRPATEEEAKLWQNIDGTIYPLFGELSDSYGSGQDMAGFAQMIVSYFAANPDQQDAIRSLLKSAEEAVGFFEKTPEVDLAEDDIYAAIIDSAETEEVPSEIEEEATTE